MKRIEAAASFISVNFELFITQKATGIGENRTMRASSRAVLVLVPLMLFTLLSQQQQLLTNRRLCAGGIFFWPDEAAAAATETKPSAAKHRRLAVATFVDGGAHLYGVYSIKQQMEAFNMTQQGVQLVTVVDATFPQQESKSWDILNQWFDEKDIYQVDREYILSKINEGLWKGVFNKLWLFNLTEFDTVIVLDQDVLIRTSLMHWFDYPTPCATQANDNIEWNSGAMVISPNTDVFNEMVDLLPSVYPLKPEHFAPNATDNWTSSTGQQGFLSAFFTTGATAANRMKTMPIEAAILSSSLRRRRFRYFAERRRHIFETVHFTMDKPWRGKTQPGEEIICDMLREWKTSVDGMEAYGIKVENDFLRNCPTNETKAKA